MIESVDENNNLENGLGFIKLKSIPKLFTNIMHNKNDGISDIRINNEDKNNLEEICKDTLRWLYYYRGIK